MHKKISWSCCANLQFFYGPPPLFLARQSEISVACIQHWDNDNKGIECKNIYILIWIVIIPKGYSELWMMVTGKKQSWSKIQHDAHGRKFHKVFQHYNWCTRQYKLHIYTKSCLCASFGNTLETMEWEQILRKQEKILDLHSLRAPSVSPLVLA